MTKTHNECIKAVADALIELASVAPIEKSKSGHKQICVKASQLNVYLEDAGFEAVTSTYMRV